MTPEQQKILSGMQRMQRALELQGQVRRAIGRIEAEYTAAEQIVRELDKLNKDKAEDCREWLYECGQWIMMEVAK